MVHFPDIPTKSRLQWFGRLPRSSTNASCSGREIDLEYARQLHEQRVNRDSGFSGLFTIAHRNIFQKFNVPKYSRFSALPKIRMEGSCLCFQSSNVKASSCFYVAIQCYVTKVLLIINTIIYSHLIKLIDIDLYLLPKYLIYSDVHIIFHCSLF